MNITTTAAREAHQADEHTQPRLDAEFLASLLQDTHGLTRDDLAVCFEMSGVSAYVTAWQGRFNAALRYLTSNGLAVKRGERYFSAPKRECAAHCGTDLSGRRSDMRYCSVNCRRIGQATARRRASIRAKTGVSGA